MQLASPTSMDRIWPISFITCLQVIVKWLVVNYFIWNLLIQIIAGRISAFDAVTARPSTQPILTIAAQVKQLFTVIWVVIILQNYYFLIIILLYYVIVIIFSELLLNIIHFHY